ALPRQVWTIASCSSLLPPDEDSAHASGEPHWFVIADSVPWTLSAALRRNALLREAVEQAVAPGRDQVGLTAAARHVRRVPRFDERRHDGAIAVDVADHGAPEGAARPIAAGQVHVRRERP